MKWTASLTKLLNLLYKSFTSGYGICFNACPKKVLFSGEIIIVYNAPKYGTSYSTEME